MHSTEQPADENPLAAWQSTSPATIRVSAAVDLSSSKRFILPKKKQYEPQYANVYFSRLKSLAPAVLSAAKAKFGEAQPEKPRYAKRIVDISSQTIEETVIVGVIFCQMPAKPSILAQYDIPSHELIPPPPLRATSSYVTDEDNVFVEDEYGRCTLDLSALPPADTGLAFATGFVLALKGMEDRSTGSFKVNSYTSAGYAPQPSISPLSSDKFLCLVSGIAFGKADADGLSSELLLEFLRGNSGDDAEVAESSAVVQLVIAGNLVSRLADTESGASAVLAAHRPLKSGEKERVASPIVEVDRFLSAAASAIPVVLMPGEADPVNYLLPQQPFHRCLLPSSARNENLSRVSNPFLCTIDQRLVLGTSGQSISDFALYEKDTAQIGENGDAKKTGPSGKRAVDIMELMLSNRHIAPTCPDTLASYPFADGVDPFVLETTPHIFFTGNQREFASRLVKAPHECVQSPGDGAMDLDTSGGREKLIRLVSVPRFDQTGQVVLVNLRTLDCTVREFALTM